MPVLVVLRKIQRKAIPRIAQPQTEGLRSPGLGAAPQQAEKPFVPRKRNGWFFAFVYTDALLAKIIPNLV